MLVLETKRVLGGLLKHFKPRPNIFWEMNETDLEKSHKVPKNTPKSHDPESQY